VREDYGFYAYEPSFTGGVRVAAGYLDGDGRAEIVTAPGPGSPPVVRGLQAYADGGLGELASFYAYDSAFHGGVFVAVASR